MLPWGQIITTGLTLADLAQSLYKKTKDKPKSGDNSMDGLLERVNAIEFLQVEQSKLLQKITEQNNLMVKKVRNAYLIAIISDQAEKLGGICKKFYFANKKTWTILL